MTRAESRLKEIDGLRALAILLVVGWHYLGSRGGPLSNEWHFFIAGRVGVDLFFVLSGYLITSILLKNAGAPNYFSSFYGRRCFRILPIYFVVVFAFLLLKLSGLKWNLLEGAIPWWSYLFGIQNFWMASEQTYGASWLAGTWSLAVEEQFYLLFPLVVLFVSRRHLPRVLVAIIILCPIARGLAAWWGDSFAYYVLMPMRADILAVGALIACLRLNGVAERTKTAVKLAFAFSLLALPLYAFTLGKSTEFQAAAFGHSYLVVLFGSTVFLTIEASGSRSLAFMRSEPAAFFARISYALYLVHVVVLQLVFGAVRSGQPVTTLEGAALTLLAFAISVGICAASYRFFEGPLTAMGHRLFSYDSIKGDGPKLVLDNDDDARAARVAR